MCEVKLSNIISKSNDLPTAGLSLYNVVIDNLNKTERVFIDMQDVQSLPSIFLNVSIGRLIDEYGKNMVKDKIAFKKISQSQAMRIKEYFDRY